MIDPVLREESLVATTNTTLRQFAVVWIVLLGGLSFLEAYARDRWTVAYILGGLAITVGTLGLAAPRIIRPLFVGLMKLSFPIGWVVSKVILLMIFYVVFTPVALLFKLIGRDALARRPQASQETYWRPRQARDVGSYFHQS
jgi:Saxitoxin biosynthesis operon protein SxtJ